MARKTKQMLAVERQLGMTLEKALPDMVTEHGLSATAVRLGITKSTLSYWLLKLGMEVHRVCLAPGESIEIKRTGVAPVEISSARRRAG